MNDDDPEGFAPPRAEAGEAEVAPDFFPEEDETPALEEGWLGAIGQMAAAVLVVLGLVVLFIGAAVVFRWLWP
jgi:hypothetical protein